MAVALVTDQGSLVFEVEFPTGMAISKSAQWHSTLPIARWAPIFGYSASDALQFTLNIRLSIEEGPTVEAAKFLLGLVYPDYSGSAYKPPTVILVVEKLIVLVGHCNSVNLNIPDDASWIEGQPAVIDCSVQIVEDSLYQQSGLFSHSGGGTRNGG
jgi:hypothetical protein